MRTEDKGQSTKTRSKNNNFVTALKISAIVIAVFMILVVLNIRSMRS